MAQPKTLPGFDTEEDSQRPEQTITAQVIEWFNRDYGESQKWKDRGREIYLATLGDSAVTRYYLADELRKSLLAETGEPVENARWSTKSDTPVPITVSPPKLDESRAPYVDWIRIADYFLLSSRVSWDALEEENQNRKQAYDKALNGQELRQKVKTAKEYLRDHPKATNKAIIAALKKAGTEVAATQLTLARFELSQGIQDREDKKLDEPRVIPLYAPLYF